MINVIYILAGLFAILFLAVAIVALVSRNKVRNKIISDSMTNSFELPVALAGTEDTCHLSPKNVPVNAIEIIRYTDPDGKVLNPNSFDKYVVSGNSMKFAGIDNNNLIFVSKSFTIKSDDLPVVMLIHRDTESQKLPDWKIRRVWCVTDFGDELEQTVINLLDSDKFQKMKTLPDYPGDKLLLEDFMRIRVPHYAEKYISCENPRLADRRIVISSTYDTANRFIHLSIHPFNKLKGKVVASFPLTSEQLQNIDAKTSKADS